MILREPDVAELSGLSDLCLRSKAHWGYPPDMLEAFRRELTLADEDLACDDIRLAEDARGIAGVVQVSVKGGEATLEKLFVEPSRIGEGIGQALYDWACRAARDKGALRLVIDADPDAAAFYIRMGGVPAGNVPSGSIPGRTLPRLIHALA